MSYLYHYSTERFEEIITREEQSKRGFNILSDQEKKDLDKKANYRSSKHPYYKELSFMIDRLPFDIILSANFSTNHKVYRKGNLIYEYKIRLEDLPQMYWQIVESPTDNLLSKLPWFENNLYKKSFFKIKSLLKKLQKYESNDMERLKEVVEEFEGTYPMYYKKWINSKKFNYQKNMYAASIPHVQLYPLSGNIKIDNVQKINL